jgi:hypothetical protein
MAAEEPSMFHSRQGVERRFAPRRQVVYRLDVVAPDGRHGCLLDLSDGGMRVRFAAGQDLSDCEKLTIELPRWLGLGRELRVRGRFAWIRTSGAGATESGFAFGSLARRDERLLGEVLEALARAVAEDHPRLQATLPA